MSEEQPPGGPERPEAQPPGYPIGEPPGSNPQGPKPLWRRTPFLMAAPPLTLVMIITIVGCVSASTSTPASSSGSPSAAAGSPSAAAGSPSASASCTSQVQAWLTTVDDSGIPGNTVQHDIYAVMDAAMNYQKFDPVNPDDPGSGPEAGQVFLSDMTDLNYQGLLDQPIPPCADPAGDFQEFMNAAQNGSGDTAGTALAEGAVEDVSLDIKALNVELGSTAPGVQVKTP
jgi:hypothetical protein